MNNKKIHAAVITMCLLGAMGPRAIAQGAYPSGSFVVESYYKVKWGYAGEFITLYKKNHYPLLKKAVEKGDILKIIAEKPRLHSSEESRWDYRVILVFKSVQTAYDPNLTEPYKKLLYPDLDKLARDEQHRFELLIAHWDTTTEAVNLDQ